MGVVKILGESNQPRTLVSKRKPDSKRSAESIPKPREDVPVRWEGGRWIAIVVTLGIAALLLCSQLGRYSLWDDEALTALHGQALLETGDTSAVIGQNIIAFRSGMLLKDMKDRTTPPLQYLIAGVSLKVLGNTPFAARLPFALLGLGCVAVMLAWAWRATDLPGLLIVCIAIVGNVELMLYSRQCRYYAISLFLTVCIAMLYVYFDNRRRTILLMSFCSCALLAANYMHFAALYLCLGLDYLIWGRRGHRLNWRQWAWLFGPILAVGVPVAMIWNPAHGGLGGYSQQHAVLEKLALVITNLRDMNRCEFAPVALLVAAPLLYFLRKDPWLLRGSLALLVALVFISLVSPQIPKPGSGGTLFDMDADVRYVVVLIPLGIGIVACVLGQASGNWRWLAVVAAIPIFWTNLPQQVLMSEAGFASTPGKFVRELVRPAPPDCYAATADWINQNVGKSETVLAVPGDVTPALIFAAPKAVYAWQLAYPPAAQFRNLPEIHFFGRVMPDYIIAFGPIVARLSSKLPIPPDIRYVPATTLDVYPENTYRPELIWRTFEPLPGDPEHGNAVYILKKSHGSVTPAP